jgi:hypothetical protein
MGYHYTQATSVLWEENLVLLSVQMFYVKNHHSASNFMQFSVSVIHDSHARDATNS